jgi:hypothetical protein
VVEPPPSDEAVLARLCPPGAPHEQVEAAAIARLERLALLDEEAPALLRALGRPDASPEAI